MLEAVMLILVAVAALVAIASRKPDAFRVERAADIKAPAEKIFALLEDFHAWNAWSPWAKKDPVAKGSFSGPAKGVGAAFAWDGNAKVGKGRMEIIDSEPVRRLVIKLDFEKPFKGQNQAEFTLRPMGDVTRVTWAMTGPMPFISKIMSTFFDMDKMIGQDFEAGLASIATIAEQR
jgi:uncharacterized protein YndB with AHSA1/START domain